MLDVLEGSARPLGLAGGVAVSPKDLPPCPAPHLTPAITCPNPLCLGLLRGYIALDVGAGVLRR